MVLGEVRICIREGCDNEFELTAYNKIYCSKECKKKIENLRKREKTATAKKKSLSTEKKSPTTEKKSLSKKTQNNNFELNGFKILDKIDGITDKIYFTLRASKIHKYPIEIQEKYKNTMNNIIMFLENELKNINGGRKIIEI